MTSEMTSRERVQATVRGGPVDRVPVMTWLNPHAGLRLMAEFQPASSRLAQYLGKWLWKNFKNENGLFSEDVRAILPIFYSGYVNQGYALDCGSDLVSIGLGITKVGDKIWREDGRLGDRLTFSTGIDVQQGERMTPDELRDDILRAYRIGGRNGRHILGYSHMLQYTMPAENIAMLLETVRNIQEGRYDD